MNILVTGGTGFIGRHIVWQLLAQGHQVTFTGRNVLAAQQVQQLTPQPARWLALEHGHAEAPALLQAATRGVDAVVHTTGLSSPWGKYRDFYRANVQSTEQLVRACEQNGVQRLVHISTPSLYFRFADCLNIREAAPLPAPVNHYAATKALAETVVQQSALPEAVLLRPRAVFGPWDNTLMPRLIRVLQRGAVPTPRQGAALVDLTCVENLADGVLLALTQPLPRAPPTTCRTANRSASATCWIRLPVNSPCPCGAATCPGHCCTASPAWPKHLRTCAPGRNRCSPATAPGS